MTQPLLLDRRVCNQTAAAKHEEEGRRKKWKEEERRGKKKKRRNRLHLLLARPIIAQPAQHYPVLFTKAFLLFLFFFHSVLRV
ncbi:unnamed protein product [Prunus armeniaca]